MYPSLGVVVDTELEPKKVIISSDIEQNTILYLKNGDENIENQDKRNYTQ